MSKNSPVGKHKNTSQQISIKSPVPIQPALLDWVEFLCNEILEVDGALQTQNKSLIEKVEAT